MAWRRLVAAAATAAWPAGELPVSVSVLLRITHYAQRQRADMDNIVKPIQDALQGIAYTNDRLVSDVTANWRDIDDRYRVRYMPEKLGAAFGKGSEFVYIRLWLAPDEKDLG